MPLGKVIPRGVLILLLISTLSTFWTGLALASDKSVEELSRLEKEQLIQYARDHGIAVDERLDRDMILAIVIQVNDSVHRTEPAPTEPETGGYNLPDPQRLRIPWPDLDPNTLPGKAWRVGQIIIGFFGLVVLTFCFWGFLAMFQAAARGKMSLSQVIDRAIVLGVAIIGVLTIFGGTIVTTFNAVFEFLAGTL